MEESQLSEGSNTRERDREGQEANRLGGSMDRTSALKGMWGVCVCSTRSHRKLEDGTVKSLSTSHVLPLNRSCTDTAIADRPPSSPTGS